MTALYSPLFLKVISNSLFFAKQVESILLLSKITYSQIKIFKIFSEKAVTENAKLEVHNLKKSFMIILWLSWKRMFH